MKFDNVIFMSFDVLPLTDLSSFHIQAMLLFQSSNISLICTVTRKQSSPTLVVEQIQISSHDSHKHGYQPLYRVRLMIKTLLVTRLGT